MNLIEDQVVSEKFNAYPDEVIDEMKFLRNLIIETAKQTKGVTKLKVSLKWGEPSFSSENGSPIRIDWKSSNPKQYAMYFHCQTKLLDTFKELYSDKFIFEDNRAIVFSLNEEIALNELKHCISLALQYHKVKGFPLLGT